MHAYALKYTCPIAMSRICTCVLVYFLSIAIHVRLQFLFFIFIVIYECWQSDKEGTIAILTVWLHVVCDIPGSYFKTLVGPENIISMNRKTDPKEIAILYI